MKASVIVLSLVVLALAGCTGSLLESRAEAPETYRLTGKPLADRGVQLPMALSVARPRASPALDTDRIAVMQPDSRFDYFAGVRWSEAAPQMLQQQLVQAVAADGRFAAVVAAPSRVPADLLLDVELRHFEVVYPTGQGLPQVRVEMQVSLVDARRSARITSFVAAASVVAGRNRRADVIAAFEQATAAAIESAVAGVREAATIVPR